jgi:hypothetical protein
MDFQAHHVEKITGVKRNRLQAWLERGYIKPSIQVADGHGTRNIYALHDLYAIATFKKIVESGLSRELVAQFIKLISSQYTFEFFIFQNTRLAIIRTGERIVAWPVTSSKDEGYAITIKGESDEAIRDFDDIYIINYQKIANAIDAKIKEVMREK